MAGLRASVDRELDEEVWKATVEEKERGWLIGPLSRQELDEKLGLWIGARRFGVRQGPSVRPIDDYTEFEQNAADSAHDEIGVGGLANVLSVARAVLRAAGEGSRLARLQLSSGRVLEGPPPCAPAGGGQGARR